MKSHIVSIGMPVFNGAATIERAVRSLQFQSMPDFELVISDNSSTDATLDVLYTTAKHDPRIRIIKQSSNIGAAANFKAVFREAVAEYFMWAACDDWWHPEFIEKNLANLRANSQAIASMSNVLIDGVKLSEREAGVFQLIGAPKDKIREFCRSPGANSRFYSLYRRNSLDGVSLDRTYLAADWSFIVDLLQRGDFITLYDFIGFDKSLAGAGSSLLRYKQCRTLMIEAILPFYRFSSHAMKLSDIATWPYLLLLNYRADIERMQAAWRRSSTI